MPISIQDLLRNNVRSFQAYSSARDEFSGEANIFLDANENAFGPVVESEQAYHRYPDPLHRALRSRFAELEKIRPEQIFVGNGSDEAIDLLMRAFCQPSKDQILIMPPTYGMYKVCAELNDINVIEIPLLPDFQIDRDSIRDMLYAKIKMIFLASPNNPTGNLLDQEDIIYILQSFKGIVVVDEAYVDFCSKASLVSLLPRYNNLVILRTFSKAWGLAGLRLGMALADPEIIQVLNKIKPPYNVNLLTQQVAQAALAQVEVKDQKIAQILEEKAFLEQRLSQLPVILKVYPSDANFFLLKVEEAKQLYRYLINRQIIVRDRSRVLLCEDCLRVTVGTRQENEALLEALKSFTTEMR